MKQHHTIDMTKQYSNSTDIKVSQISDLHDSILAHNLLTSPAIQSDSINNHDAEGVGYAPIGRELTQNNTQKVVSIERGRQKIVSENYPIFIPGIDEPCEESKEVIGAYRCNDCHTVEIKVNHCNEWSCRICGQRKVRRQAKNMVRRLYAFKHVLGTSANPRHFVISSDKWRIENYDLSQVTKAVNNLFSRYLKCVSGVYVVHMFRIRGWDNVKSAGSKARFESDANIKRRLREYREDKEIEVKSDKSIDEDLSCDGFWEMVKEDVLNLGSWKKYCYVSPHIHVLGWGKLPQSDKFHEDTGLIYKMIDTKGIGRSFEFTQNAGSFDFSSEVLRTLNYLGSHSAIRDDETIIHSGGRQEIRRHANRIFRPFGLCSTKVFTLETSEGKKVIQDGDGTTISGHSIEIEIICPTCHRTDLSIVSKQKHGVGRLADFKNPFDEEYNPIDSEGDIIPELISPLKFFEWNWYVYKFKSEYLEDVRKFSKTLPKSKPYQNPETSKGSCLSKVLMYLEPLDVFDNNNTNDGVMIE